MRRHRRGGERASLPPARSVALVALGGAAGTVARLAVSSGLPSGSALPWSTLVENVSGTFALGWLLTAVIERRAGDRWLRPLLGTGALGAYTTFETVGLELHHLSADGRAMAAAYFAATWVLCLAACGAGIALGRAAPRRRGL